MEVGCPGEAAVFQLDTILRPKISCQHSTEVHKRRASCRLGVLPAGLLAAALAVWGAPGRAASAPPSITPSMTDHEEVPLLRVSPTIGSLIVRQGAGSVTDGGPVLTDTHGPSL